MIKTILKQKWIFLPLFLSLTLTGCFKGGRTVEDVMASEEAPELAPLSEDEDHVIADEKTDAEAEEDSVGLMAFYPNGNGALSALAGMNTFTFYFEHDDVEFNEGRIGLYDAEAEDDPLVSAVDVTDTERCEMLPIDEDGINISNFNRGAMAVIHFDRQFEAGKKYYVLLDSGCFKRGDILSTGIANASYIAFSVKEYGIATPLSSEYAEGEDKKLKVLLGGDAAAAGMLEYNSQFFTFLPGTIHESGDIDIHFSRSTAEGMPASCTLAFYNKGGQRIDSCVFCFDIAERATDRDLHSALYNQGDGTDVGGEDGEIPDDGSDATDG